MKTKDKVSIVIPVYNAEKTVERCVKSICEGTYDYLQVILIEDCSKDGSWGICQELEKRYECVQCIQNERNRGVSYTRNQGLRVADGKYLMFVDSDDWVEPDYVETFVRVQKENGSLLVVSGYVNHDEVQNGKTEYFRFDDIEEQEIMDYKDCLEKLFENRFAQVLWNKIFQTDVVKQNHIYFDESISIGEDFRFILTYLEKMQQEKIVLLNKLLYHYMRDNPQSLMASARLAKIDELLKNQAKMQRLIGKSEEEITKSMGEERKRQIELYCYFIYRNVSYSKTEKKQRMKELSGDGWRKLYYKNKKLDLKEKIARKLKDK